MSHERKNNHNNHNNHHDDHNHNDGNNNSNGNNNAIYRNNVRFTSDISNGYVQSEDGNLFMGKSVDLSFSSQNKGYVVLRNPQDAETDMVLNSISIANLSNVPVRSNLYINARISVRGMLKKSNNVAAANTDYKYTDPVGELYYGRGVKVVCGDNVSTAVTGEYTTETIDINGSIIIKAGDTVVIELSSLSMCDKAKASVSVTWWEENSDDYNNNDDDNGNDNDDDN